MRIYLLNVPFNPLEAPRHWRRFNQRNLANVLNSPLESVDLPWRSFDVITMWDVIDHVPCPDPLLNRCHQLLNDGGLCFIRTPNVTVQVRPLYSFPDQSFEPMIQVGAPLPIYNRNQGNILAARADITRTREQVRQVELRLTERLAASYQRYQAAREQREIYEKRILPQARESLRLITFGYERGDPKYDFTALLQAQTTLVQSQLAYVQVLGDVWRAVAEIKGLIQDEPPPAGTSSLACPP